MHKLLAPLVVVLAGLASPVVLAASSAAPAPGSNFVVLTLPWQSARTRVVSAGGLVLSRGRLPFLAMTMAHSDSLAARLQADGPVWFLNENWGSVLCS